MRRLDGITDLMDLSFSKLHELYVPFPLIINSQEIQMAPLYKLRTVDNLVVFLLVQTVKNLLQFRRPRFDPWAGKILWSRVW